MARLIIKFFITLGLAVSFASSAHLGGVPVGAVEASLVQVQHNAYLMTAPSASTGNVSTLHIINTSDQSQQFYGTLYDQDGNRIGEEQTLLTSSSVAPYARVKLTSEAISDIFGGTWSNPAMLEVYGTDSFSLMIRLSSPSGLISNTNCVTEDVVHNLDGFDATDLPFVRFINTGSTTLTDITGTLYNEAGSVVGSADQVLLASLAPRAQTFVNRNALAATFGEQWDGVGSLYIADRAGLKLILVSYIVESATFFNFSCFDGNNDLDNPVNDQGGPLTEAVDITNVVFTETSSDCATYAEAYRAAATDVFNSKAFTAQVTVTDSGNACTLTSNAIPNHDFNDTGQGFANQPAEVERTFSLPRNPGIAFVPTEITQGRFDGVMLNGVVLDLLSAGCYKPSDPLADQDGNTAVGCSANDDWLIDPLGTENKFGADSHNAHTQPDGTYHYHGNPNAMFDDSPGASGSPVIGFAADGFPIYGSYFLDPQTDTVRKAVSGYTLKHGSRGDRSDTNPGGTHDGTYVDDYEFTNAGDLDTCNGMTLNGQYGYYVTDSYPWILKCHNGTPDSSFLKN